MQVESLIKEKRYEKAHYLLEFTWYVSYYNLFDMGISLGFNGIHIAISVVNMYSNEIQVGLRINFKGYFRGF